jgi:hypothetical protein
MSPTQMLIDAGLSRNRELPAVATAVCTAPRHLSDLAAVVDRQYPWQPDS